MSDMELCGYHGNHFPVNHWMRNVESNSLLKMYIEHMNELSLAFIYYKGQKTYYLYITWIGLLPMRCIEIESTEGFTVYSLIAARIHVTFSQVKENLLGVQWMHMYVNVCLYVYVHVYINVYVYAHLYIWI